MKEEKNMDNKDYNDYMNSLFKDISIEAIKQNKNIEEFAKSGFRQAAKLYNEHIAHSYLTNLAAGSPRISEKITSYPYMFWKTGEALSHINQGIKNSEEFYLDKLQKKITSLKGIHVNSEHLKSSISHNLLDYTGEKEGILIGFAKEMALAHTTFVDKPYVDVIEHIKLFTKKVQTALALQGVDKDIDFTVFHGHLNKIFYKTPLESVIKHSSLFSSGFTKVSFDNENNNTLDNSPKLK